ncbi:hypothetical protein FJT64_004115 [Amphibalanus amphitrite]|uniref:Uncharacterized protein n=1 Tax=Amphibalanus amphitrite TaxID=1232801 RepID=A0A6A4VWG3_AMPAM|nr:hypothetical protein FJT64_004115 [Amphibalanus amphitrite]
MGCRCGGDGRGGASGARWLLVACCAALAAWQCRTLLMLYRSEPVSMSLSFTPMTDVDVPAITVCLRELHGHRQDQVEGEAPARRAWLRADPLTTVVRECEPNCTPEKNISYPGGEAAVPLGTWRVWMTHTLRTCFTFRPNVTWGQLADTRNKGASVLKITLRSRLNESKDHIDYDVAFHNRVRPILSSLGSKMLQPDYTIQISQPLKMELYSTSYVHERPNLRRAPCNSSDGYSFSDCLKNCSYRLWANRHNCSTPPMLEDFPHLKDCPLAVLESRKAPLVRRNSGRCDCAPSCRRHTYTIGAEVAGVKAQRDASKLFLRPGQLAEQVALEQRSYQIVSMISEMGGIVSLLLGVSLP